MGITPTRRFLEAFHATTGKTAVQDKAIELAEENDARKTKGGEG